MFEIPKIAPSKHGSFPIITFEIVSKAGEVVRERNPTVDEVFALLRVGNVVDAFNLRADFDLWKRKQDLAEAWGEWSPGIWRGKSNPYSVK